MMDAAMRSPPDTTPGHGGERMPSQWPPGPLAPQLEDGVVDVWRADLQDADDAVLELLSAAERERAAAILDDRSGLLWARSRGVLRALLGSYLNVDADTLRFDVDPHGKPSLPADFHDAAVGAVSFNLSHSGAMALYAIAPAGLAVGVDVQVADRQVDAVALARRVFGAAAASDLQALAVEDAQREFLRLWVRHEAALKCSGTGFRGSREAAAQHASCWIEELDVGEGQYAAVAVAAPVREVRRWCWAPIR
jgi:4'-phosphopantetheinyl transferase